MNDKKGEVDKMSTYIFVHGAWQGKWAWELVKPQLELLGHKVITFDLPGSGEDTSPSQHVSLDEYINKVVSVIQQQEGKVILVGHSMGGVVISQTAEYIGDKIDKLVYLCAALLKNGESLGEKLADQKGPEITVNEIDMTAKLIPDFIEQTFLNATKNVEIKNSFLKKVKSQSLVPFQQKIQVSEEKFGSVERFYIETTLDNAIPIEVQRKMHIETPCKKVISLEADHSPFFSKTVELVKCLDELK